MSEIGPNDKEVGLTEPMTKEIIEAVKTDIPSEDLEPMIEACGDDIGDFLGAIYSYMMEFKGMTDDETQDYLIEKGLLQ